MSKYSRDELRRRAKVALILKKQDPAKWRLLIMNMMARTMLSPSQIEFKIKELAK